MRLEVPTLPPSSEEPNVGFPYACGLNFTRKTKRAPLPIVLPYEPVDFVLPRILEVIRDKVSRRSRHFSKVEGTGQLSVITWRVALTWRPTGDWDPIGTR
jgi:hypothetical protein